MKDARIKDTITLFNVLSSIAWVFAAIIYLAASCDLWAIPEPWYFGHFLESLALAFFFLKFSR